MNNELIYIIANTSFMFVHTVCSLAGKMLASKKQQDTGCKRPAFGKASEKGSYNESHMATQNEFAFALHFPAYMKICFDCLLLAHRTLTNFFLRCSSPILCVDFIFEANLFISLLPTEQKTVSGRQN